MVRSYFLSAWRTLSRNRLYAFINMLGLALGICACLVIGAVVRFELGFDHDVPNFNQLFRVSSYQQFLKDEPEHFSPTVPKMLGDAVERSVPGIARSTSFYVLSGDSVFLPATGPSIHYPCLSIIADASYPTMLGMRWLAGNPDKALQTPFSVVLSSASALKYFGPGSPGDYLGKELIYQDSLRVHVTGIVRDRSNQTDFPYTDLISHSTVDHSFLIQTLGLEESRQKFPAMENLLLQLENSSKPQQVQTQIAQLFATSKDRFGVVSRVELQPLQDVHFSGMGGDAPFRTAQRSSLYILSGIALFILVLAIINYVNLSTAQSLVREKEVSIRKVLGSGRMQLIVQFMCETFLLTGLAAVIAVLAVRPVLNLFHEFVPEQLQFRWFAADNLMFVVVLCLLVTALSGLYPAVMLSAPSPIRALKGSATVKGESRWWLRRSLIVFQFTVSLLFIISSLVIARQLGFMLHQQLGFKPDAVLLFSTNESRDHMDKVRALERELRTLPGVQAVAASNMPPAGSDRGLATVRYASLGGTPIRVEALKADESYVPLYQIQLLAGRNLFTSDTLREVVINENMSKALGFSSPAEAIGKQINTWNKEVPIVGVVADFHKYSYKEPIRPLMIMGLAATDLAVRLDNQHHSIGETRTQLAAIARIWKAFYPNQPFVYDFFDEELAQLYRYEQTLIWLLRIATGITVLISGIGLFGLTLFTTARRTREIGIRKVLGAAVPDILFLLGKDFFRLMLLATVIASAVGWYILGHWLQNYAYRIRIGLDIFLMAGVSLMLVMGLTILFQSLKASLANPVRALRTE